MQKKTLILSLVLYLASAVISFSAFSYFNRGDRVIIPQGPDDGGDETLLSSLLDIDPNAPRDQACPLNGKLFTEIERDAWEKRRPLAVMIENHPEARPQSGLSDADIVFEAVAEGGVTRYMAMYYCGVQAFDTTIAPVRSARSYFVDWASGFNLPLYVHVGGANVPGPSDALGQIRDYGWNGENDLNQFSIGYPTFVRDYNRLDGREIATEHTMVSSSEKLWEVAAERDWTNMSPDQKIGRRVVEGSDWKDGYEGWSFSDDGTSTETTATKVSHDFWSNYDLYSLVWTYDSESKAYLREMGGEVDRDLNNEKQIAANTVIVLLTTEKGPINEKKHMLYGTTGTGDALIFMNGTALEATWTKKIRTSELVFKDSKGKNVVFTRGLIWISALNKTTEVEY